MNAHEAIKFSIGSASHIVDSLLADLNDTDLLHRPAPGCNHINWQVGHCIAAEHATVSKALPGAMPPLPAGFAEKYNGETAKLDDPKSFCTKAELLRVYGEQRAATLAALEKASAADLDKPCTGWTPNLGAMFTGMASLHWLMHVGQWTVVRRELGRAPLF
jgi:DinB superfamily